MGNPLESATRSFVASSKNSIPNLDKYLGIMNSQEGQQLLGALSERGGDAMKQSARQAASGDTEAARQLLSQLMSSNEGRELAKQVMDIYKRQP